LDQNGRCALEILLLESGEREHLIRFDSNDFAEKVEEHLAFNQSWIAIPFQQNIGIWDIQKSQIKYLEKTKGNIICKVHLCG
jgi:hypothetical protein